MSSRIPGPVVWAGLFVLATVTYAQNAWPAGDSIVKLAQATTQPGSASAPAKTSKSKVKKVNRGKRNRNGGAESQPAAPAVVPGPPDPGKYL